MLEDILVPIVLVGMLFIGLPWIIFHYVTKWKAQATLTEPDEKLLESLHDAARRLDDRICTIERIMSAEDPQWRDKCALPDREERGQRGGGDLLGRTDELLAQHEALMNRTKEK